MGGAGDATGGLGDLAIALVASGILGLALLLVLNRMIDGVLTAIPGLTAICAIVMMMSLAIHPPHPALPALILVTVVAVLVFFPFAGHQLERIEHRAIDTDKLDRAYQAMIEKPDNMAVRFEIASRLQAHGLTGHAIALSQATLDLLSTQRDEIRNTSMREMFRPEEAAMKRWKRSLEGAKSPPPRPKCPSCGHLNSYEFIVCEQCGRPYLLDAARKFDVRPRFIGKLVLAFALIATLVTGAGVIGMTFEGPTLYISFSVAVIGVGALLWWLFRPRQIA